MPIQNIVGMMLPFGVAIAIGAIFIGIFYRERNLDHAYGSSFDYSDFHPDEGYDTGTKKPRKKDEEEDKCIICFDTMKRMQCIKVLPCAHKFHKKCINEWLKFEQFCPMCRTATV